MTISTSATKMVTLESTAAAATTATSATTASMIPILKTWLLAEPANKKMKFYVWSSFNDRA